MRTYEELIDQEILEETDNTSSQIKSNLLVSYPVAPEQATKQYEISKATNIPIGTVRAKENEILKRTELATFDDKDLINNFPKVAAQLADFSKTAAIKDDIDSLSTFEKIARSTKEKFQQSAIQDETVDLRIKRMKYEATNSETYKLTPVEESDIATFEAAQPKDYDLSWLSTAIPETTGAVRTRYGTTKRILPKVGIGGAIGAAIGAAVTRTPAGTMAGLRFGAGATAYAASGYEMAKLEAAGAYDELRTVVDENGKPLEKNVAAGAAIATGVINGAIELIPVKVGLDSVKKAFSRAGIKQATKNPIIREYLGNIAKGVLVEGGTEGVQELFNIIAAESAKILSDGDFKRLGMKDANDTEGLLKFLSDSASRIGGSFAAGSAAGLGISTVGGGAIATKRIYDQRKTNEREQEIISQILDTSKQSKILNRSPKLYKDVTAETLGEVNLYIPAEQFQTYFQDKPDKLTSLYSNAPDIRDQIQEALETGGNVVVKANELSAAIKADPELESLKEFTKLTPESFTSLEAQDEFLQTVVPSYFKEEQTRIEKSGQDVIRENIRKQLSNLGMPFEVAKQNIDLLTSFYDTQVKRYGAEDAQKIVDSYIGNLEANVQKFSKQPLSKAKIENLDLFLDKARKPIKQPKAGKPLIKMLKEKGGVQLGSNLAGELKALGITPKTMVGLFKKEGGLGDVDNFVASELQEKFPQAEIKAQDEFVDRQYFLDLLREESFGKDISQIKTEEQLQIENFLEELDRAGIDINQSNEEIKKAIKEFEGQTFNQTQAFKKWFGDSKVVDEKGKPLVVYHGSNAEFDTFDIKKIGQFATSEGYGFYLTDNKDIAKGYQKDGGSLIEAFVSMQKPLDSKQKPFNTKQISSVLSKMVDIEIEKFSGEIADYKDSFLSNFVDTYSLSKAQAIKEVAQSIVDGNETAVDQISELSNVVGDKTTVPQAIRDTLGFDGIKVKDFQEGEGDVFIAWFPNQIKSVENKGTFNPENPNIYYQSAPTFYSALEKQITDLPQGKGSPEQWAGIIKNFTQKGVKQEELDWTGIEDWIKEQKGSVSKEQILDYLKANKIEVEEVVKTKPQNKKQVLDILKQIDWQNYYDSPNEALEHLVNAPEILDEYNFEDNEKQIVSNYITEARSKTKFSKYTLAGGENYRELLLTLPVNESVNQEKIGSLRIAAKALIEQEGTWKDNYDTVGRALNDLLANPSLLNDYNFDEKQAESIKEYLDSKNIRKNEKSDVYKSSHYDEQNILAHIRFNERTDKDGARVMFVEELQSDWHQEGRKKGYKDVELLKKVEEEIKTIGVNKPFGQVSYTDLLEAKASESLLKKYEEAYDSYMGVPNAPFKTTWNELAFKRALLWAVENGFDKVAWTTGEQQAERYDLSKQIDSIAYAKASDGKTVSLDVEKNGSNVFSRANISINELPDLVGKEVADKIVKGEYTNTNDLGYNVLSGLDLKVGGEGMKAFYDKIVPSMVNKLAKKFGGKVETSNIKEAGNVWSLEITPAMRESIQQQGLPLFQNEAKPQGQTQFLPNKPIITLFETADRSTLLHELGHVFLQIQADLSKLPNMPKQFQKDWAVIEKFLDIKDGKITREAHEQFARSFEAYLREGKAPTVQLREAFRKFKAWLIRIYKDVLQLNTKINNDIRGVFDRMLATDEQIELNSDTPLFKVDANVLELLTKVERKDYLKRTEEAKEKTKEILLRKALKQKEKENSKAYKEEKAKAQEEVRDDMNKDKTFRALHFLKTGKLLGEDTQLNPVKLDRKEIQNYDGEFIKYLPKEIFGKNSAPVEMIAEEFGFKNGSDMLFALANAKDFKEELEAATDAEMMRRYGDMVFDGSLEREALEASDNEAVAKKIVYELDAINRKVKTVIESKEAYKAKAKEMFATKKIPDAIDVNKYYINELKAARESGKALGKKDYEKAVEWKKKQLLNHYLFQESSRFKKELVQANRSYKPIKRKPSKGKVVIDEEFRQQALSLLQNFGLAEKPFDYKELSINELENWKAQKKSEDGVLGLVEFPEIADFQTKDFKELTTEEFRSLNDSIQNLAHVGRELRMIEVDGKRYELNALADDIAKNIRDNLKSKPQILGSKTVKERLVDGFDEFTSTLTKAKLKAELLDGEQFGKFYNTIIDPVSKGELVRTDRNKEAIDKYEAIYRKHFGKKGIDRKRIYESNGNQFSKESIIALTLNWGTKINRRRVIDGFNMADPEVMKLMSKLDKNELDFIQDLWNFLDSFWGETSTLNKKLYGFSPSKQKAEGFKVKSADGQEVEMAGGYYPIAYAESYSDISALETIGYSKALSFDKSYLKERTNQKVEKKLELTLIPAIQHISDVVSDLSIKEASFNSFKILNNRKVKKAILETEGKATFKIFDSWIKDLFGNGRTTAGTFGKMLDHIRAGTVISAMGLKFGTTVMQISGYPQSIVKIGFVPMAKGLLKFLGNGNPLDINKSYQFALAKSDILKTRQSGYSRDVYDVLKVMEGKGKISRNLVNMYFYPMSKMQMLVDLPTWYGAYYKGLKDFKGDDTKAVKYADKIVVQAQGSGLLQDLSAFERGSIGGLTKSNLIKLFTPFMTYFNAKYNLALESYKNTDFKKPSNIAKFTSDILLLYMVEALIGQFVLGKIPDFDDEDEDSALAYTFKLMADNYFAQFPIVRETYSGLKGFDTTPAGLSGLKSITSGVSQIKTGLSEEEVDIDKIIQGINQTGGVLFHYPSGQIDVFIDASQRAQEGEEVPVIDYLKKPKK